jgi:hypothetical protein
MGSNPRYDIGISDPSRFSTTNNDVLGDIEEFGGTYLLQSAGAETRILPRPTENNQFMVIAMHTYGGNVTIAAPTGTVLNQTGNNRLLFAQEGDCIGLIAVQNKTHGLHWRIMFNDGVELSTV